MISGVRFVLYHATMNDCQNGWGDSPGDDVAGVIADDGIEGAAVVVVFPRNATPQPIGPISEGTQPGEYTLVS